MRGLSQRKYRVDLICLVEQRCGSSKKYQAHCDPPWVPRSSNPCLAPRFARFLARFSIIVSNSRQPSVPPWSLATLSLLAVRTRGHSRDASHEYAL
jgi:hypothetical protein